jgi:hypothetical protein
MTQTARFAHADIDAAVGRMERALNSANAKIDNALLGKTYIEKRWFGLVREEKSVSSRKHFFNIYWNYPELEREVVKEVGQQDWEIACWLPYRFERAKKLRAMAAKASDGCITLNRDDFEYYLKEWM